jgi:hypothetical protein
MRGRDDMRRTTAAALVAIAACMAAPSASAYQSGSDGSLGDFMPTTSVAYQLPEDGVLNFANVVIPAGVTVTFKRNARNTGVWLLATGDVVINGTISVNGEPGIAQSGYATLTQQGGLGGPGGFDGGWTGQGGQDGQGPAGGANQAAGGSVAAYQTIDWSSIRGGGGAGGYGTSYWGGGGGGVITVASSGAITLNGTVMANGASNPSTALSGGAGVVRIVADAISGTGKAQATGSSGTGYVKIETLFFTGTFVANSSPTPKIATPQPAVPFAPGELPTITITSINNQAPTGTPGVLPPDLTLPTAKAVTVQIATTYIQAGTILKVAMSPIGLARTVVNSTPVVGDYLTGTATATITPPAGYRLGHVQAWVASLPIP